MAKEEEEKKEDPPAEDKAAAEEESKEDEEKPEEEKPAKDDEKKEKKSDKPHIKNHWVDHEDGDIFESTFGKDRRSDNDFSTVSYEESSDYDREMMSMNEVRFDDESWPYFERPFADFEHESMTSSLRESELMGQVGEAALGAEIRQAVDGRVGIQDSSDRRDIAHAINGASVGWKGIRFGPHMRGKHAFAAVTGQK